jgi:hypothetical protein
MNRAGDEAIFISSRRASGQLRRLWPGAPQISQMV